MQLNREDGSLAMSRLARIRKTWLFGLPIAVLCVVSNALSGMYAWNVAGPHEYHFPYVISVGSFISSGLLILSTAPTWRLIRNKAPAVRSWKGRVGILLGV